MDKWEYLSTFVQANVRAKGVKDYLKQHRPDMKKIPRFAPETMLPELNALGEQGWELVHMQPVPRGSKGDILFSGEDRVWSNVYFCVFKRLKASPTAPPHPPIDPPQQVGP